MCIRDRVVLNAKLLSSMISRMPAGQVSILSAENGKGRRSDIDTYRITARGGKGIRNYDAAKDKVAAVKIVDDVDLSLIHISSGLRSLRAAFRLWCSTPGT